MELKNLNLWLIKEPINLIGLEHFSRWNESQCYMKAIFSLLIDLSLFSGAFSVTLLMTCTLWDSHAIMDMSGYSWPHPMKNIDLEIFII